MPLVTLTAPYGRVSGRAGTEPIVNTWNGGQPLIRQFTQPTNPDSDDQIAIRAVFSLVTKNWKNLSSTQRANWNTWAAANPVTNRLGNVVSRTGLSAYLELASMHYIDTAALLSAAPTLARPSPATAINFATQDNPSANTFNITVTHGYTTLTGLYLVTRATPYIVYDSQTPKLGDYRLICGVASASIVALTSSGSTYNFTGTRYDYTDGSTFFIAAEVSIMNSEGWQSQPFRAMQQYSIP